MEIHVGFVYHGYRRCYHLVSVSVSASGVSIYISSRVSVQDEYLEQVKRWMGGGCWSRYGHGTLFRFPAKGNKISQAV